MRQIIFLILIVCLISSTYSQLLRPQPKKLSLKKSFFKNFAYSHAEKLNLTTQCNNVNITEYNGVSLSGYLNVGIQNSSSALGFIFFGAQNLSISELKNRPTIMWLNGGPGCSSQFGNFFELGPLKVFQGETSEDFYFRKNEYAWSNEYNTIFIDQPIGTGISYAEEFSQIPVNETQVADQFYHALNELYENANGCFNQLGLKAESSPLFIYGESYAGKYIPSIAKKIVEEGNKLNLKGIGIGDGFTSPYYDIQAINQYAFDEGLIDISQYNSNLLLVQSSQKAINESNWQAATDYFNQVVGNSCPSGVDVYNIFRSEEPDSSALDSLFNSQFGQQLFHIQLNNDYEQCDSQVYEALSTDFIQNNCVQKVTYLLEQGIQVNVFNGDLDLIVPYYAPQLWINTLEWSKIEQYKSAETQVWRKNSTIYGTVKQYDNLSFVIVFNSGHMVPQDQPEASLDMIKNAVNYALNQSQEVKVSQM
ncbi:hypothetical protein ABPG74_014771 [Tetrahymena malaccensis]